MTRLPAHGGIRLDPGSGGNRTTTRDDGARPFCGLTVAVIPRDDDGLLRPDLPRRGSQLEDGVPGGSRGVATPGPRRIHSPPRLFPRGAPLDARRAGDPGPWLGLARLQREGARLEVLPLGELDWPTKLGGRMTSLALVVAAA